MNVIIFIIIGSFIISAFTKSEKPKPKAQKRKGTQKKKVVEQVYTESEVLELLKTDRSLRKSE